jgi:hypothetical protein
MTPPPAPVEIPKPKTGEPRLTKAGGWSRRATGSCGKAGRLIQGA